ncbi:right-handed parallel beta-helix repeat-containing protein [Chryseobacterium sp. CT-SW4]|uniref:hypothetical protein n=1 Tax=Chryseobacterium sp. SW-1 TaxID=3157343 RepID=UPI003B019364
MNFLDFNNNPIHITASDLEDNFVQIFLYNGVAKKIKTPIPEINQSHLQNILKEKGIIGESVTYRFNDNFDDNKGWSPHPTYPVIPHIENGKLMLTFTAGQNQGIRMALSGMAVGVKMNFRVTLKRITNNGSKLNIGTSFGTSTTSSVYSVIKGTSEYLTYPFSITPINSASSTHLVIGMAAANNFGDTFVIDSFIVDEVTSTGASEYISFLKEVNKGYESDLQSAILNGDTVLLRAKTYEISNSLNIPNGTIVKGVKGKTVIKYNGTGDLITLDGTKENITFEDIIFEGLTLKKPTTIQASDVKVLAGLGNQNAVNLTGYAKDIFINRCVFRNFTGCGVKLFNTQSGNHNRSMKITNSVFYNNFMGLYLGTRSEYHQFSNNSFNYNQVGVWVEGGNNFGAVNHFNANSVGIVVTGINANNDTHGSLSTCTVNHNLSYSLFAFNVNNGFTFNGCHFFEKPIYIENSRGIVITGGEIAAPIHCISENKGYNIISNNIFFSKYGAGTIVGSPKKLSMSGNRTLSGGSMPSINNNI